MVFNIGQKSKSALAYSLMCHWMLENNKYIKSFEEILISFTVL